VSHGDCGRDGGAERGLGPRGAHHPLGIAPMGGVNERARGVGAGAEADLPLDIVPGLSQPLVWTCDMRHVTGQWTGECKVCNDSHDIMQVSESILCRSINR